MCTGRVDPALVADAFVNGADGVLVIGCYFGDCHYITGNFMAKQKLDMAGEMLAYAGLNPIRLQFRNLSSAEGARFAYSIISSLTAFFIVPSLTKFCK